MKMGKSKILTHTATDPTKHMTAKNKKGNMGFMADDELKPHKVSASAPKKGGGSY